MLGASNQFLRLGAAFIACLTLAGCGYRMGDFTVTTTKNLNIPITKLEKGPRVSGEDCAYKILLFIPIGHIVPDVKSATDQALEKEGANFLLDTVWEYTGSSFILFSQECIKVTGTAVKAR